MHQLAGGTPDADQTARDLAARFDLYDVAKMAQRFSETDVRIRHASIPQLPFEVALVESILRPTGIVPAKPTPSQPKQLVAPEQTEDGATSPPPTPPRAARPVEDTASQPSVRPEPDWMRDATSPEFEQAVPPTAPRPSLKDRVRNPGARVNEPRREPSVADPIPPAATRQPEPPVVPNEPDTAGTPAGEDSVTVQRLIELWGRIRQDVKLQNRRIEALLAEVDPVLVDNEMVTLRAAYPFHRNRLEEQEVREVVQLAISKRVNQSVRVRTVLRSDEPDGGPPPDAPVPQRPVTPSGPAAPSQQTGSLPVSAASPHADTGTAPGQRSTNVEIETEMESIRRFQRPDRTSAPRASHPANHLRTTSGVYSMLPGRSSMVRRYRTHSAKPSQPHQPRCHRYSAGMSPSHRSRPAEPADHRRRPAGREASILLQSTRVRPRR